MKPKIKTISIGGKKVKCQILLDPKMILEDGDVDFNGTPVSPLLIGERVKYAAHYHRPLKKPAVRAKRKSVKCYGILKDGVLQPEAFPNYVSGKPWTDRGERCVPVLITLLRPSRKGK